MRFLPALIVLLIIQSAFGLAVSAEPYAAQRSKAQKLLGEGNAKEALTVFQSYVRKADVDARLLTGDITQVVQCLRTLNQIHELDAFLEEMVEIHADRWQALEQVAKEYKQAQKDGFIISGAFRRGPHRGGGKAAYVAERDRIRSLQLFKQAELQVREEANKEAAARFYWEYAQALGSWRQYGRSWRLQYLSDLSQLPDVTEGHYYHHRYGQTKGAPVDAEGNPVLYSIPKSWEAAENDGERWRWLMHRATTLSKGYASSEKRELAEFLHNQFGVQTLAHYGYNWFGRGAVSHDDEAAMKGTFALPSLKDSETIARLASGVKRFSLPEEFNYVRLYREVDHHYKVGTIYQNRMQFPAAAKAFKQAGNAVAVDQIVNPWGQFEQTPAQSAEQGEVKIGYRYRNGKEVTFTARKIEIETLIEDIQKYVRTSPKQLDWNRANIQNLGYRIIYQNQRKYVGRKVEDWKLKLKPRKNHFDRSVVVDAPLDKPGAYLVTANIKGGNESNMILWVNDTVIVKKAMDPAVAKGPSYYFVADAATGKPVAGAKLDFFGYWQDYVRPKVGKPYQKIQVHAFKKTADANGQVFPTSAEAKPKSSANPRFIVTARDKGGRFAFLGFSNMWFGRAHDQQYNQTRTYIISDRPVYRPNQTAEFKGWRRKAQYDMDDVSVYAGKRTTLRIYNPKNEEIFKKDLVADEFGGFEWSWAIPEGAALGVYRVQDGNGQLTFRVEEYKKPEFEVLIEAPTEPVMLGEEIEATIEAKYFFGAPVVNAKVKYKVTRSTHDARWYPYSRWDWMYGKGYWWFGYNYDWYPGWHRWGCIAPIAWWYPRNNTPPEVVLENEVEIGDSGKVTFKLDTTLAKEMHGDSDHRYQITAEVTDESRRTIVGQGQVTVAREPFKVYAWVDRGYYRAGEVLHASFSAQTVDGNPLREPES